MTIKPHHSENVSDIEHLMDTFWETGTMQNKKGNSFHVIRNGNNAVLGNITIANTLRTREFFQTYHQRVSAFQMNAPFFLHVLLNPYNCRY